MNHTNRVIIGFCAAMSSLAIFGAVEAQAEVGAKWLILSSNGELRDAAALAASLSLRKDSLVLALHTEILKVKVLFLCTSLAATSAKLLANGSIGQQPGLVSGSKVLFSGCTTDLNGSLASECTPSDPINGPGTIVTNPGHGLLVLGAVDLISVLPDQGETLTTIVLPPTCPIGTKVPVIGKLLIGFCEFFPLTHMFEHLLEQGPGTELWTISKTAEHVATLLGSVWASLTGEHINLRWSGDPA